MNPSNDKGSGLKKGTSPEKPRRGNDATLQINHLLASVLENSLMPAGCLDAQFRFIWVNRAYAAAWRRDPSFFPGKSHFELHPDPDIQALFQKILDGGEPLSASAKPGRFPDRPARGVTFWDWSLYPLRDTAGKITGLAFTLAEATERIRLREALRESEALSRRTFDEAPIGAALVGLDDFKFARVNEAFCRFTGYSAGELKSISIRELTLPEDLERTFANIQRLRSGEVESFVMEKRYRRKDGSIVWGRGFVSLIRNAAGEPLHFFPMFEDITESKRTEEALKAATRDWQKTFDALNDAVWLLDPDQRILRSNLTAESFFNCSSAMMLGRRCWEVVHGTSGPIPECPVVRMFKSRRRETTELQTGSRWLEVTVDPVLDTAGGISGAVHVVTDITERKQAEFLQKTRLQLSGLAENVSLDELMQTALDSAETLTGSKIGFFHFVNADQKTLTLRAWSSNTLQTLRPARDETLYPAIHAGVWADCFHTRAPVIRNDSASPRDKTGLPKDHAKVGRELAIPILRGGLVAAIIGVGNKPSDYTREDVAVVQTLADMVMDMVAGKQAGEALRQSEEKFRAIANHTVDWELWIGSDGRLLWVNPAVERITGYSVKECHAMSDYPLPLVAAEDRAFLAEKIQQALKGARGEGIEFHIARKDGAIRWGLASWQAIADQNGRPLGIRASIRDITERKILEERLRQSQKMEAVGRIAAGVAHEFNNIMAAMTLNLNLLQLNLPDDESGESLREMENLARRAASLVQQLLAFGRKSVLHPEPLDLDEVLNGMAKILRRFLGEDIELEISTAGMLPPVRTDKSMIEQVIMNLCLNARDAMPKGGRLGIHLQQVEVNARRAAAVEPDVCPGLFVCLSVSDTGCGMDPETLKHLFEPFFTTKEIGKGTGLGLAMVHGIVQQHQGWVEVESQPGKGSVFKVYLPATTAVAAREPSAPKRETPRGGSETILLVEDEPAVRNIVERFLKRLGYQILKAGNGREAIALWEQHQPAIDLLYTDMIMPGGITGLELSERLRQDKPGLKVIISSGYSTDLVGLDDITAANITFLPKPFSPQILPPIIRACLDGTAPPE